MRENRGALFNSVFTAPYAAILRHFYVQNYQAAFK
jgi:hypothetical protein